jgi:outer membrane receptor protein involved in Fe transport
VAYLNANGTEDGTIEETIVQANLTGDLGKYGIKSPWAQDGVGVALGAEHRRQTYHFAPDQASLSGDLSGFGGASTAIDASLSVNEYYGEFHAPIAQDMPLIHDLSLDGGYRYSDYSSGVTADTYKVGLEWAPTTDIRFRASFNRAIRAPNIVELFNPQSVTNTTEVAADPCAPTVVDGVLVPASASLQQCMNTGVTAAQYGNGGTTNHIIQCPAGQCAVLQGGNPKLNPEKANTYTVGFTLTPSFIPGFSGSLDYYQIKLEDTISAIPLSFTLNQCLTTGNPTFCSNVVRAPSGILFGTSVVGGGYINGSSINIGSGETSGIDVQANYRIDLEKLGLGDHGSLTATLNGSDLMKATTTPTPGAHTYDCAGLFGPTCQTVNPKWRHTLRVSWQTPWDVMLSAQWRYIGQVKLETNTSDPTLTNGKTDVFDAKIPAESYLDLSGVWNVRQGFSVRAGVNNVFDKDPPLLNSSVVGTGLPNSYPTYDLLGRTMFVAFTANF